METWHCETAKYFSQIQALCQLSHVLHMQLIEYRYLSCLPSPKLSLQDIFGDSSISHPNPANDVFDHKFQF
jgi:hypothetical protein